MKEALVGEARIEALSPERREGTDRSGGDRGGVDPEVPAVARRRTFSASYKRRILEEADRCTGRGEIGLLLRREGLYSSQLHQWRKWRSTMSGKKSKGTSRSSKGNDLEKENARLRRKNARLQLKLKRAEGLLELQKKAAALFEHLDESNGADE